MNKIKIVFLNTDNFLGTVSLDHLPRIGEKVLILNNQYTVQEIMHSINTGEIFCYVDQETIQEESWKLKLFTFMGAMEIQNLDTFMQEATLSDYKTLGDSIKQRIKFKLGMN